MINIKLESLSPEQNQLFDYFNTAYKPKDLYKLTYSNLQDLALKFHCEYEKVIEIYQNKLGENLEKSATCNEMIQEYMESLDLVSTEITELDKLLNGGFYTSQLFEVVGAPSSGKTEFCLNILKSGYKNTQDRFLFLDSGQSFSYCRFAKLINLEDSPGNIQLIEKKIIHKIFLKKKHLLMHLISLIKDLEQLTNPLQNSLRYIIIDSFSTVCYPIADITEFDFWISEIVKIFKILISKYFIGILVTTIAKNERKEFFGYRKKRCLPSPWHFYPNVSLFLEKSKILNPEKSQMNIITKYTFLQNEYSDFLQTVKTNETLLIK